MGFVTYTEWRLKENQDEPVYNADIFRWRFRMRRHVFLRIVDALSNVYSYFQQRVDATGRRGLSSLQKCTDAIRMLAYGVAADAVDDYVHITIKCLENLFNVSFRCSRMNTCKNQIQMMYDACYKWQRVVAFLALLEVVASSDFCIWHAFFGVSSSNNDINVLDRSPVFDDILNDHAPEIESTCLLIMLIQSPILLY
ncbi:uncharacterized protein [Arachis hypogaea]|uniref:uncharacterized protein n=1 Tax=Arachis hypogaea TaxID=3818 RepID=UPI000DECC726|nr:uncharacterized protein LOC112761193 [Arachis hypogaea]